MLWPDLGIGQNDRAEFSEIQNKIRNAPRDVSWVADSGLNRVRPKNQAKESLTRDTGNGPFAWRIWAVGPMDVSQSSQQIVRRKPLPCEEGVAHFIGNRSYA